MNRENVLPIRQLTLYKHGVAFVQRQAPFSGESIDLVLRSDEVNDALKSLLVIDRGDGQVLGVHYATPADASRFQSSPITLSPDHSLLDLLRSLRGWLVRLVVGTATEREELSGRLLGIDIPDPGQSMFQAAAPVLVSMLADATGTVRTVELGQLQEVTLLEPRTQQDLDFFLQTSRSDAAHRAVTIRLSPGEHDLRVSYLVPSPTWRVSYRLVAEATPVDQGLSRGGTLLLQGWGLFDNPFEEDLRDVAVTLTAGQPISFLYDLVASRIPQRPVVQDSARVAAAPVEFDMVSESMPEPPSFAAGYAGAPKMAMRSLAAPAPPRMRAASIAELAQQPAAATGSEAGELFQYDVVAPVSVQRGESALVPILSTRLPYERELLFNEAKLPGHPVAALRFTNASGLVLERGPVTVVEDGNYRGEAILPFSRDGSAMYLAYAVELGIKVSLQRDTSYETAGLRIEGGLLHVKQATVIRARYRLENTLPNEQVVTVEHPIWQAAELIRTPAPVARTADMYRWNVSCPPRVATTFDVVERRYDWQASEVLDMQYARLEEFLRANWLDQGTLERIRSLLEQRSAIARNETEIERLHNERETIFRREEQLRANMAALGAGGEEGTLRRQIVMQLQSSEDRIGVIDARIDALQSENTQREATIETELEQLAVAETGADVE